MTRLLTVLPMACDGVGPSYTCTRLLAGMARGGLSGPLYVNRARVRIAGIDYRSSVPGVLSRVPYSAYADWASRRAERRFLADLAPGDIAYLWPSVSLATYRTVRARGIPIVGEGINTRMRTARDILDAAYRAEGLAPSHGITDERIREEEEKLALTDVFFAPSPEVERSLAGSPMAPAGILSASYGGDPRPGPARIRAADGPPTFLFVGYGCIRKGLHQLLRAWVQADTGGRLVIAGTIEPAVQALCADMLARPDVQTLGFVRDVDSLYAAADVFILPSFEEGDPLVTYEAAAYGLPIIASPMGAGRIGAESDCALLIDPADPATIAVQLQALAHDAEARQRRGDATRAALQRYGWEDVGRNRALLLRDRLAAA